MVISHRHNFLYFVIPKCASATVRRSISPFADIGWPVANFEQHMTINRFLQTEHAGLIDRYFKFTFVRNPYDRIYSGYLQDRFASENYPRWINAKKPIFDRIGDDFSLYLNDYALTMDIAGNWEWICFCPMSEFAFLKDRNILDFVGKAEALESDIQALAVHLGIDIEKAPDENVRTTICMPEPKYLKMYDRRSVANVNRVYADDFKHFGYQMLDPDAFPENSTSLA